MDSFPDRTHVLLWMREYGAYLYAKEDGEDIAGSPDPGTTTGCRAQTAWAVHRVVRDDTDYVLFHSAATGGYLALMEYEGYCRAVQCTYDSPEQDNVLFQAVTAEDGSGDIFIRNFTFGNWIHPDDEHTPMRWVVEAIPQRLVPPELPNPIPGNPPPPAPVGGPIRRRCGAVQPQVVLRRRIRYVRADGQGNFNPLQWRMFEFEGRSVFNLRRDLAAELGEANNVFGITLCVRAGSSGRRTPLIIDLTSNERTMDIIVLTTGSLGAQELVYPNIDA